MDKGVDDAIADLARHQAAGRLGIQDGKLGEHQGAAKIEFFPGGMPGDHRVAVGLRAGGREGQDRPQGNGGGHRRLAADDLPRVPDKRNRRRDPLGAIKDRTATDRQEVIDTLRPGQLDGLDQGFVTGIGFDAAKLQDGPAGEGRQDLGVDAIAVDAAAAEGQEDPGIGRNLLGDAGDLPGPEMDARRIVEGELHGNLV